MACNLPFFVKSSLNLNGLVFIFVKKSNYFSLAE